MRPTVEGIREAAYARWERRGRMHGADREDWQIAERQGRFADNYRVISCDRAEGDCGRAIGSPARRRCRFCGQSSPRTTFGEVVRVFGKLFGAGGPFAFDQCDECSSGFGEGIEAALARFVAEAIDNPRAVSGIGIDAFKGLVKIGLALMPDSDLDEYEEAIEWVANPDHDFDLNVFRDLAPVAMIARNHAPSPWAALAARAATDEAWPSRILFVGFDRVVIQVGVPMGQVDEDLDVFASTAPDLCPPSPFGPEYDPIERRVLTIRASWSGGRLRRLSA